VLGIEHDEVEAGCAHHLDQRRASCEALNAERNPFLLKHGQDFVTAFIEHGLLL
jgi:hypothetical protein